VEYCDTGIITLHCAYWPEIFALLLIDCLLNNI